MIRRQFLLPHGFEVLEPFVARWAISGSAARARLRDEGSREELAAFFTAANDYLEDALDLLDRKPLDALDEKERRLLDLMLSLAHVSLAVEVQRDDEPLHMLCRQHMRITRTPADLGA